MSKDSYKSMVRDAWAAISPERYDGRGFVKTVEDLVKERDQLKQEVDELERERDENAPPLYEA